MPTCQTCRYWQMGTAEITSAKQCGELAADAPVGECARVYQEGHAQSPFMMMLDVSGHGETLFVTRADFGCLAHSLRSVG